MAFVYNPTTGKFEIVPAKNGSGTNTSPKGMPGVVNKSTTPSPKGMLGVTTKTKGTPPAPPTPRRPAAGPPSPVTGLYPSPATPAAPAEPAAAATAQDNIDAMWQAVYDEAQAYQQIYGEQPPSSWWTSRTTPIENAQKRYDIVVKGTSGTKAGPSFSDILANKKFEYEKSQDAAALKKAAEDKIAADAKAETDRLNKIAGGKAGETFLRESAKTRKIEMMQRVAEIYDPLQTATEQELIDVLKTASDAFDLAEKQVGSAQEDFAKNFKGSTAYEGVPISTYSVADNPLLAALQQQGAGTGEVQTATDLAKQTGQQTSDLEKWVMSQLNTGQQNYGSSVQNAAQMGTMAALQQLGGRRAEVKSGINTQFAEQLALLARERAGAGSDVDSKIADIISEADRIAANTIADYGTVPATTVKTVIPDEIINDVITSLPAASVPIIPEGTPTDKGQPIAGIAAKPKPKPKPKTVVQQPANTYRTPIKGNY